MPSKSQASSQYFYGIGRRKESTARAKFFPSAGPIEIILRGKPVNQIIPDFYAKTLYNALTNLGLTTGKIELFIKGGGVSGQTEAARLAIAKALVKFDSETYKTVARMNGYLSTDIRKVLPKRTGLRKNRKREQWSKR